MTLYKTKKLRKITFSVLLITLLLNSVQGMEGEEQAPDLPRTSVQNGGESQLVRKDLSNVDWRGRDLAGVDLRGSRLKDAILIDVDLKSACLRGCDLRGANLSGANLEGADLYGANFEGAIVDYMGFPQNYLSHIDQLEYEEHLGGRIEARTDDLTTLTANGVQFYRMPSPDEDYYLEASGNSIYPESPMALFKIAYVLEICGGDPERLKAEKIYDHLINNHNMWQAAINLGYMYEHFQLPLTQRNGVTYEELLLRRALSYYGRCLDIRNPKLFSPRGAFYYWRLKKKLDDTAESSYNLALHFLNGEGTERNLETARDLFLEARAHGYLMASYNLGLLHEGYYEGHPQDIERALFYYLEAINENDQRISGVYQDLHLRIAHLYENRGASREWNL